MKKLILFLILILPLVFICSGHAKSRYMSEDELKTEAQNGFASILDLWREGKYAELFERSTGKNQTRESFTDRLSAAPLKPTCCWDKMQNVTVRVLGDNKAVISAKLGFEGAVSTEYKTGEFRLVKEDKVWRMSRSDILSLAEAAKKKQHKRKR